jgi:hypothetical protein
VIPERTANPRARNGARQRIETFIEASNEVVDSQARNAEQPTGACGDRHCEGAAERDAQSGAAHRGAAEPTAEQPERAQTSVTAAIATSRSEAGATIRPRIGNIANVAKPTAEIQAAWKGRARVRASIPSSSRTCAPSRSCALSCFATAMARSLSSPR